MKKNFTDAMNKNNKIIEERIEGPIILPQPELIIQIVS